MSSIPQDPGAGAAPVALRLGREETGLLGPALGAGLIAALLLVPPLRFVPVEGVFWHFFSRQLRFAIHQQADWGHTLVVPFIAGYFVWLNRERLLRAGLRTTWLGLPAVVAGVAWYQFCWLGPQAVRHHNLQGAGVSLSLFGIVLLFAGWRAMAFLWFPLAYLCVFGQTISDRLLDLVTFRLQQWTAVGSHVFLGAIGIDADRTGNILTVWNGGTPTPLNIAEACSGMRMLMAFLALGVAMAYTGLPRLWQRIALVAMGVPVAIAVNVLRVATLSVLTLADVGFAAGEFHSFVGLLWLVPAFLFYLGVMWVLRHVVVEGPPSARGAEAGP